MKREFQSLSPLKILAVMVLLYLIFGTVFFRLDILNVLPLFFSVIIMFLQSKVNRYAFLIGSINAILYAVAYFYMTLFSSAVYALLVSFPLQFITFLNWQKNTRDGITNTRRFTNKGRLILFGVIAIVWILLYAIFSVLKSEYLVLDNTVAVIGIIATLLCALRYSEYAILQVLSKCISIVLYSYMTFQDPGKSVWLVFSIYGAICSVVAFVKMSVNKKQRQVN